MDVPEDGSSEFVVPFLAWAKRIGRRKNGYNFVAKKSNKMLIYSGCLFFILVNFSTQFVLSHS